MADSSGGIIAAHKLFGEKGNFALRGIMGTIAIYFINMGVTFLGFTSVVGINAVSILTTGILGIPGIVMLYGLSIYEIL
mgnify:CR=1 FL=1